MKVVPSAMKGVCEVQVSLPGQGTILYTDAAGEYLITGHLIDAKSGRDLSEGALMALNAAVEAQMTFTPAQLEKLATYSSLTLGTKGPVVTFVTDPQCPYCKKASPALKAMADRGELQARIVMYPLPMHQGAKEQSIAVICDKKSFEDFEGGYTSENQCAEGKKKIEEGMAFLQSRGIGGTPAYIFEDGRVHSGMIEKEADLKAALVGAKKEAAPAAAEPVKEPVKEPKKEPKKGPAPEPKKEPASELKK
jgi:thiol:disulfide interchange protein DsbC